MGIDTAPTGLLSTWRVAPFVVPPVVIALAGLAARTPLAAAYPAAALLLFLWVAADTLMLALVARTPGRRPPFNAAVGALATACMVVWFGSPDVLRERLLALPLLAFGMVALVAGHVGASMLRAGMVYRTVTGPAADRWRTAAEAVLPEPLVRLAAAELSVIHMALFRWGGPADVPADCRAFAYHKHLAPMCAALLILSGIEVAVYHLLVGHWSRTAALVMFVASDVGLIYLVGLIKSFRFRPVLMTPDGVQVRAGFLIDHHIPFDRIAGIEPAVTGEAVRDPATLNAALLAWPNIMLRLDPPLPRRWSLRRRGPATRVAFRLDDPVPFVRLLEWRLGKQAG